MSRRVPADLEDALASNRAARDRFWAMPPDQKDAWVGWVDRARMPRRRRRRIAEAVRRLSGPNVRRESTMVAAEPAVAVPRENALLWVLVVVLVAAAAALVVWLTLYRHHRSSSSTAVVLSSKASVPKVVGIRVQAAQFQLREAKLGSKVDHKRAAKPKGIVVGQSPKHGASVAQGTAVTLVVSNGPPGIALPDFTGLAAADAAKALQARGLSATLKQVPSTQPAGTVVAQSPKPGKCARHGTQVVLQVAKGKASVSVPSVTGRTAQQASTTLEQAGLRATVASVPSTQPKDTVVAQHPAPGAKVAQGSAVRLNVSKGPPATTTTQSTTTQSTTTTATATTSTVPQVGHDYRGMRLSQAVQRIVQGRQQVTVQYVASSKPAGVVVASTIAGSRERLQVSAGPQPKASTDVPDVTGEDAATATSDLRSAGFSVVQAQWPVSDSSQNGMVTFETPAGGQQAPGGVAIVIYVGAVAGG
jgi:beta-lactam-binding protein with PASTA domain